MADNVKRMNDLLERHPDWTWTPPERLGQDHVVTYPLNGKPDRAAHNDLGRLADYLEALDRGSVFTAARGIAAK